MVTRPDSPLISTVDAMRPERKDHNKLVVPSSSRMVKQPPSSKWKKAGDAIVAAARLRNDEVAVYNPEQQQQQKSERRVAIADAKNDERRVATLQKQQLVEYERRQLAKAGKAAHTAAQVNDAAGLAYLVQQTPAIANYADENEVSPLLLASAYGRLPCAEVLCGAGADVNKCNVWGSTPLINAAYNAHASVVHFLILHDANVSTRDKDGTALDGALRRLVRMVRGVEKSTDPKHPDKKGLEAASAQFTELSNATNRGPVWHKKLEAAFVSFKPLLAQAEDAQAMLGLGKAETAGAGPSAPALPDKSAGSESGRPGSAASSKGSGKGGDKKKKDDDEGPDEGRAALYTGMAAYIRCVEMLRDPSQVRKDEKLRVGGVGALVDLSDPGGGGGGKRGPDGLTQKVGRVKSALALDVSLTLPQAVKQANLAMGIDPSGSLPEQTERLVVALGLQ